ncbi:MAG: AzlD domain-containing protein [Desulfobulbaceae bacterium]|nr:AzlD domain-containing protein [Desulfofustis sp.]NNK58231.1 AzlD domain-containing protein [Desulfofustis sp.]RZW27408.1 MAG: AzlD domain-containing protein [Desulfobulbaceae bacterium]
MDILVWLTIIGAALVTYSLRVGGLLLAGRLPKTGRFKRFMDALPGTILLSLIVPAAIGAGPIGWVATFFTGLCSLKTGNVFLSMVVGILIVAAGRWIGV